MPSEDVEAILEAIAKSAKEAGEQREAVNKAMFGDRAGLELTRDQATEVFNHTVSWMALEDKAGYMTLALCERYAQEGMGTMGVAVNGTRLLLYYDPAFVAGLTRHELRFVLTHEVMHIVLHHCTHLGYRGTNKHYKDLANKAQDLAINCMIPVNSGRVMPHYKEDLVVGGEVQKKAGDHIGLLPKDFGFDDYLSPEEYFKLLLEKEPEGDDSQDGSGESGEGSLKDLLDKLDNHEGWGTPDNADNEVIDQRIRELVDRIEKTHGWGDMSSQAVETIKAAQRSQVDWRTLLRVYYGSTMSPHKRSTILKPNRRFGYPYLGVKKYQEANVLVAYDTSLSVSTEELSGFLSETLALSKKRPVDLITFDTVVHQERPEKFQRAQQSIEVKGRGGTNFEPPIAFAKEFRYRYLVIFTDGECFIPEATPSLEIIWIITSQGQPGAQEFYDKGYRKVVKIPPRG
jgi:predicted metal-dependent peptidase